jgi:hypothetical protein
MCRPRVHSNCRADANAQTCWAGARFAVRRVPREDLRAIVDRDAVEPLGEGSAKHALGYRNMAFPKAPPRVRRELRRLAHGLRDCGGPAARFQNRGYRSVGEYRSSRKRTEEGAGK